MLMPFGKHRGKPVAELPEPYLVWLLGNVELRGPLKSAVRERLGLPNTPDVPRTVEEAEDIAFREVMRGERRA